MVATVQGFHYLYHGVVEAPSESVISQVQAESGFSSSAVVSCSEQTWSTLNWLCSVSYQDLVQESAMTVS